MTALTLTNVELGGKNLDHFVNVIYENFIDIAKIEHLNHTKHEISNILHSANVNVCCYIIDKK